MHIKGFDFVRTCTSHPEQYDVYRNGRLVGYVRLRYSLLTADVPYCGLPEYRQVFKQQFDDFDKGAFVSDEERVEYLGKIADAILEKLEAHPDRVVHEHYFRVVDKHEALVVKYRTWCDYRTDGRLTDELYDRFEIIYDDLKRDGSLNNECFALRVSYVMSDIMKELPDLVDYDTIDPDILNFTEEGNHAEN